MNLCTLRGSSFFRYARLVALSAIALGSALTFAQGASNASPELQEVSRLVRAAQYPAAIEKVNAVLATKPKDALARFLKGVALTETGKANDAIAIFQSITEDNPELPEPYNNLAVLYASKGQFEKARTALELAIQTHPSYSTAHENLGDVYAKLASQAYDRALQLDKGNAGVQGKLGLIKDLFSTQPRSSQKPDPVKVAALNKPDAPKTLGAPKAAEPTRVASIAPPVPSAQPQPAVPSPVMLVTPVAPAASSATSALAKPASPAPSAIPAPVAAAPVRQLSGAPASTTAATPALAGAPSKQSVVSTAPADSEAVLAAVKGWARAWSSRDADAYVANYAGDFKPDAGKSRRAWEAERRERVASPSFIKVEVLEPVVLLTGDGVAEVKFRQNYTSDRLKDHSVRKTLTLAKTKSGWQITKERNG